MAIAALRTSFSAVHSNMRPRRLFREDEGVEGCGLFHRRPEQTFHVLGNILRVLSVFLLSPANLATLGLVTTAIENYLQSDQPANYSTTPDSVLSDARGGGKAEYEVAGFRPTWILEVKIATGTFRQIPFSENIAHTGYLALSYPTQSAAVLAREGNFIPAPAVKGGEYTLDDRRTISRYFLELYCSAARSRGDPERTEYIWLDEFCLSNDNKLKDDDFIAGQRSAELGRLADIFNGAMQVVVFCHEENCDHTRLECAWGQRLFTIPEILHARTVQRLIRTRDDENRIIAYISQWTGADFRQAMQINAARGNKWHLDAILQHTVNAGAVPWQATIHAMVAEAIRRVEAGNFHDHEFLGKALNGLLPRRARLTDLGNGGWKDLAWLLELNQGFYNAASLAAVCSISDDTTAQWLGKPIEPAAGNERLEPAATAFPVANVSDPSLSIINGETLGFRPSPLKRDPSGLHTNEEMKGLKTLAWWIVVLLVIISLGIIVSGRPVTGVLLFIFTAFSSVMLELLVSTMYLDRVGWVFLEEEMWGDFETLQAKLGAQDHTLRRLKHWGDRQLVPKWEAPGRRPWFLGKIVDLRSKVCADSIVVSRPNAIVPLAVHGTGVTCMLLERPENSSKDTINMVAQKVGMCNLPPYIFAQTVKSGTVYVGNPNGAPDLHW